MILFWAPNWFRISRARQSKRLSGVEDSCRVQSKRDIKIGVSDDAFSHYSEEQSIRKTSQYKLSRHQTNQLLNSQPDDPLAKWQVPEGGSELKSGGTVWSCDPLDKAPGSHRASSGHARRGLAPPTGPNRIPKPTRREQIAQSRPSSRVCIIYFLVCAPEMTCSGDIRPLLSEGWVANSISRRALIYLSRAPG